MCVCVYSISRNDVPRVAQRFGTIAAHIRRRAFVIVVFVVFCVHMYSFAGLIRRMPPPTFSDTAVTDRHSITTIFQLRAHWVRTLGDTAVTDRHSITTIFQLRAHWVRTSWSIGLENRSDMCPGGSRTLNFLRTRRAPYPLGQALLYVSGWHILF